MSDSKFKYFEVSGTTIVKANNMTDAKKLAKGARGVPGRVLAADVAVDRLSSTEAHDILTALQD